MNKKIKYEIKELKKFLLLWGSQSLSTLGSSMTSYVLLLWVYRQKHSTMSVAMLAVCTYLPPIILGFFAGAFVDRNDKKKIMLICDSIASIGTITVFLLMTLGRLEVPYIYFINLLISSMNAFQTPADAVVASKIVPQKHYMRIGGLQSISNSAIGILTPALATSLVTFVGISVIFIIDILTFIIAVISLLFLIEIPDSLRVSRDIESKELYLKDCKEGFLFLFNHKAILQLILYFTAINLVAYIGGGGITTTVAAMILSRVPDGEFVLGVFSSAVGLGTLLGGFLVTLMKEPKRKTAVIFIGCGVSFFLCDISLGIFQSPILWIIFNFVGNLPISFMSSNQDVILRTAVPIKMQGRVFSARNTFQYCTIPLGYLLGGVFADYVFEPIMRGDSFLKHFFAKIVGQGSGSGIALMFIFTGIIGTVISILGFRNKNIRALD